jgi:hypothetical protein
MQLDPERRDPALLSFNPHHPRSVVATSARSVPTSFATPHPRTR